MRYRPADSEALLQCQASLFRYARALTRDSAEAEELVQETFKRALEARRWPESRRLDEVRPWLFTILRNVWQNRLRGRKHEIEIEPEMVSVGSGEAAVVRKLLAYEVRQAVDELPPLFREVVVLRDIEDLSYSEIAAVLDAQRAR